MNRAEQTPNKEGLQSEAYGVIRELSVEQARVYAVDLILSGVRDAYCNVRELVAILYSRFGQRIALHLEELRSRLRVFTTIADHPHI